MGDEPYAALLPWVAFAVVDRTSGDGPLWAATAALVAAITLMATSRPREPGDHNIIVVGAIGWFALVALASGLHWPWYSVVEHDGRSVSALGFVVIAFGSIPFQPAMEHYTRQHVVATRRHDPGFRRVNVTITKIWALAFVGITASHAVASSVGTQEAITVCNWIVPIAIAAIAAYRSHAHWDEFTDSEPIGPSRLRDLSIDWDPPKEP